MFQKGEFIIYGNSGVCEVLQVGPMKMTGVSSGILYYTLKPKDKNSGTIYTPVTNSKVHMRKALNEEEALTLIDGIKGIDGVWLTDERGREQVYLDSLKSGDATEWIRIIKTLSLRRTERLGEGKKVAMVDEKYLKMAENMLYEELAFSLKKDKHEMMDFITKRIDGLR